MVVQEGLPPNKTRREYVHVGSIAASMLLMVLLGGNPSCLIVCHTPLKHVVMRLVGAFFSELLMV
jgi:hypothetical protein